MLPVVMVLSCLAALLGRAAWAAEPTTPECLGAHEDSLKLRNDRQLRAARAKLLLCSSASCPAEIRTECTERVSEIDASIPTIVFEVKDAAGDDLVAVRVKMDGAILAERLEGAALPVDPGAHTFTFEAEGRPTLERQLLIMEGEKLRRERVELDAPARPKPVPQSIPPVKLEVVQPAQPPVEPAPPLGKLRVGALVAGGVGVAATGVGAAFGLVAWSRKSTASDACPTVCKNQNDADLWERARSAGNVSTVAFIVGGVGLATGAVLWWRGKPSADDSVGARVIAGPAGLQVLGHW
jgi:hypothetical protein